MEKKNNKVNWFISMMPHIDEDSLLNQTSGSGTFP